MFRNFNLKKHSFLFEGYILKKDVGRQVFIF